MSKLGILQKERLALIEEFNAVGSEMKKLSNKRQKIGRKLKDIGNAIYDLKHAGDTPHITDHAIVRYLERVKGLDIRELKVEVANHKDAVREGNVIVTVNDTKFYEDDVALDGEKE